MPEDKTAGKPESKADQRRKWAARISTNRQRWVRVHTSDVILIVNPTGDHESAEDDGDDEVVVHFAKRSSWFVLNLTSLTGPELEKLKEILDDAIELATPIARRRDDIAERENSEGDDTRARLYRAVPTIFTRQRWKQELRSRVQQRSSWASTLGKKEPKNLVQPGSDE